MIDNKIKKKFDQYNEFFSISYPFNLNVAPIDIDQVTSFEDFSRLMPIAFKLASNIEEINQSSNNKSSALSELPAQFIDLLNLQSKKIDLLMDYILSQEGDNVHGLKGISFGGGGLSFESQDVYTVDQFLEIKLFMQERHCAIFCYAQVIDSSCCDKEKGKYTHKVIFHYIRDSDRESLVRFSLKEQSKQLQQLANERNLLNK